jgi:hypothetical protein
VSFSLHFSRANEAPIDHQQPTPQPNHQSPKAQKEEPKATYLRKTTVAAPYIRINKYIEHLKNKNKYIVDSSLWAV